MQDENVDVLLDLNFSPNNNMCMGLRSDWVYSSIFQNVSPLFLLIFMITLYTHTHTYVIICYKEEYFLYFVNLKISY